MNEQLIQLATPFPDGLIQPPAPGKFGDYVAHSTVNERLLSIVGPFDFMVTDVIRGHAPAVVGKNGTKDKPTWPARDNAIMGCLATMRVTIDGRKVTITEVGTEDNPAKNHDADNLKNCASDAIKRCAMRVGCGLHLWSQDDYFLLAQLNKNAGVSTTPGDEKEDGTE